MFPTIAGVMTMGKLHKVNDEWRDELGRTCYVVLFESVRVGVWARSVQLAYEAFVEGRYPRLGGGARTAPPTLAEVRIRPAQDDEMVDLFKRRRKNSLKRGGGTAEMFDASRYERTRSAEGHVSTPPPDPLLAAQLHTAPVNVPDIASFPAARRTDPSTSHDAARVVRPASKALREAIHNVLGDDALTEFEIAKRVRAQHGDRWAESTIRAACSRAGLVVVNAMGRSPRGRPAQLLRARD